MNESESYKNWALEELMNYVARIQTDSTCDASPNQVKPTNKEENYQNRALEELMNYVNSVAEIQTNVGYNNSSNQFIPAQNKLVEVEVTAISIENSQQSNFCIISPLPIVDNQEIALSPSNLNNLMAQIQELHLSNSKLVKRVTYLTQAITEFHQDLETYKGQFQEAKSRLDKQNRELEASYQAIQEQQSLIEKLTTELAVNKQLVAQIQADYSEQFDRLAVEKDNCRDLRTRLNREQQHSLQLKVALEKCLEVPTPSYQLADDNAGSKANNLEDLSTFTPKTQPIKPWTTQTRCASNQVDLSWERQHSQSQSNADIEETDPFPSIAIEKEIDFSLISSSDYAIEDAIAPTATDEVQAVASPIETQARNAKSPSPLLYPSRPPKGRKSLASIELPSFVS